MRLFTTEDGSIDWPRIGRKARSVFAVVLSLSIIIGGGWFAFTKASDAYMAWRTSEDYIGDGKDDVVVAIPAGASLTDIGGILIDAKVVRSMKAFRAAVNDEPKAKGIQAGNWNLKTELPAKTAIAMLLDNKNRVVKRVTIIEGLRMERQWPEITKVTGISAEDLKAASTKGTEFGLPAWAGGNPEGFLYPETYEVPDKPTAIGMFKTQVDQFNKVATGLNLEGRAADMGLTPLQLLTVASLIQGEVSKPDYQPMVAAVVYNRIKAKMPIQFDSTVHYAVNRYDTVTTTEAERQTNSPYNTYLAANAGKLPPGPINSPGKSAIEAAMAPADTDALYFVTVNLDTGETLFAKTYEEQQANESKFHAWCKANPGKGC